MMGLTRIVLCFLCLASVAEGYSQVTGLTVKVNPRKVECFYEEAYGDNEKGYLHFQVTSGGAQDVDVSVTDPMGSVIWSGDRVGEERVMFKTRAKGTHAFCFSNKMSTLTPKTVAFDIVIGDPTQGDPLHGIDPIERSIIKVTEGLMAIRQEQTYLKTRERIHRNTAEDTNSRVLWFSVLEIAMLLIMGVGQIMYLRQQFEVKRHI